MYSLLLSLSHTIPTSNEREKWEKLIMKQNEITISFTLIWLLLASSCNYRHLKECRLKASSFIGVSYEQHYEFVTIISSKKWIGNENTHGSNRMADDSNEKRKRNIFVCDSYLLQCHSATCFCLFCLLMINFNRLLKKAWSNFTHWKRFNDFSDQT